MTNDRILTTSIGNWDTVRATTTAAVLPIRNSGGDKEMGSETGPHTETVQGCCVVLLVYEVYIYEYFVHACYVAGIHYVYTTWYCCTT